MKKVLLLVIAGIFLTGCNSVAVYQDPKTVSYSLEGEYDNTEDAQEVVQVIQDNLHYAQEEDMEGYLSTLISSAREETEEELFPFFESYDLEHTVLSVEILDQEENRMLIKTEQQAVMVDSVDGAEQYRDHIAEANHTVIKENEEWKIEETIMTDTLFLD
ncbi:hypothetical protein [Desemzia sp. FAM 24101]|uniref:hypothetical protein n=1 Tax=unclassified Desemzia TaxID=2685243 RepID=UPI00388A2A56